MSHRSPVAPAPRKPLSRDLGLPIGQTEHIELEPDGGGWGPFFLEEPEQFSDYLSCEHRANPEAVEWQMAADRGVRARCRICLAARTQGGYLMAKKSAKIAVGDRVRATMSPAYSVVVVTLMGEVTKLGTLDGVKIAMVRVDDPTELVLPFALGSCTKIS